MYCSAPIAVQLSFIHTGLFSGSYEELSVKDALVNPGLRCPSWLIVNIGVHLILSYAKMSKSTCDANL
jgi:hypothetical protein